MYICLCKAVTDTQIRQAASEGAETMRDLRERFEIAITCGKCGHDARRILRESLLMQKATPNYTANIPDATLLPATT